MCYKDHHGIFYEFKNDTTSLKWFILHIILLHGSWNIYYLLYTCQWMILKSNKLLCMIQLFVDDTKSPKNSYSSIHNYSNQIYIVDSTAHNRYISVWAPTAYLCWQVSTPDSDIKMVRRKGEIFNLQQQLFTGTLSCGICQSLSHRVM